MAGEEKKKRPIKIIESAKDPQLESDYMHFPGEELFETPGVERSKYGTSTDSEEIEKIIGKRKRYTSIHTHPRVKYNLLGIKLKGSIVPSFNDIRTFLMNPKMKYMGIAQRDTETGEVGGLLYMQKSKRFGPLGYELDDKDDKKLYKKAGQLGGLPGVMQVYKLNHKLLPADGYKVDRSGIRFVKEKGESLEKKLISIISLMGLGVGIFFLSPTLTGNVIANLTTKTSSIIGVGLFIVGIVGTFIYYKKNILNQLPYIVRKSISEHS